MKKKKWFSFQFFFSFQQNEKRLLESVSKQLNRSKINWHLVSNDVYSRTQTKCYHRYIHLKKNQMKIPFENDEDLRLIKEHQLKQGHFFLLKFMNK